MSLDASFTATIANTAQVSDIVNLRSFTLCGLYIPASFTGTTITFQACDTVGGTFVDVQDGAGATISKTVSPSKYIALNPSDFAGIKFLKIKSGSAETGSKVIKLAGKQV